MGGAYDPGVSSLEFSDSRAKNGLTGGGSPDGRRTPPWVSVSQTNP